MEKVRRDLQTLYHREDPHPLVLPLPTHVNPAKVNDKIQLETDVELAVQRLRLHRKGGHTHLRADNFKLWQRDTYLGEQSKTPLRRD